MDPISIQVIFDRKGHSKNNGVGKIEIRAYQDRKYKYFSSGISLAPKHWNKKLNAIHKHQDEHHLNRLIQNIVSDLRKQINLHIDRKGFCSLQDLAISKDDSSFLSFMIKRVNAGLIKESTRRSKTTTINHFKKFLNGRNVGFNDISLNLVESFDDYLRSNGNTQPTIHKHHKNMKSFINDAKRLGMMHAKDTPYAYFKVSRGQSAERDFLNSREIAALESLMLEPSDRSRNRIRKLFLLSVYTGLRFSDIHILDRSNFKEVDQGLELNFISQKTGKHLSLPLYNLWPYQDGKETKPEKLSRDLFLDGDPIDLLALHQLSNQYTNRMLKDVAYMAKIDKNLSFHIARHTFGTHMATKVDNVRLLQHLMDHSNINTTMVYIHLSKKLINKELESIQW